MKRKMCLALFYLFCTGLFAQAALFINEVNSTGKWIEIFNDEAEAIDVSGFKVTRYNNDFTNNTATIPVGTTIPANGFLTLYQGSAGSPVDGAIDCLPFGISTEKFWHAVLTDNKGVILDETFDIGFPQTVTVSGGKSWARKDDGGRVIVALEPTPGKSNVSVIEPSELKIFINEVNSTGKWIEIYNDEENQVDLGGFTVARYNNDNAIAQAPIPAGVTIEAKSFLVLYQGEVAPSPVEGAINCLTFGISADKFWYVVLKDKQSRIVDNTFDIGNPQDITVNSGYSWARETDGSATIIASEPTPGKSNTSEQEISNLKIYINEVNYLGKWIEIYNDEDKAVDVGGFSVTRNNNDGAMGIAIIPTETKIASKGYIVIYQGGAVSSPVDGAIDCMPFGISADKFLNVFMRDKQNRIVDNTFNIGYPQEVTVIGGKSWARETDASHRIAALEPTPGKSNTSVPEKSTLNVFVNEVNANGKWIEIYNDEDKRIDLSGFFVIRNNNDGASGVAIIPNGTFIEPKAFVVIYQGSTASSPVAGAIDCLPYGISAEKFISLLLKDAVGRIVDTFDPQEVTVSDLQSWAREFDGAKRIVALDPTPGACNNPTSNPPICREDGRVFVYAGSLIVPSNASHIQIFNMSGRLVLSRPAAGSPIDLTPFPKGIYVVRVTVSGQSYAQKINLGDF